MKIVNRGYISVQGSPKFWEWANANCPTDNLLFQNDEPSIYLIEEDFWEEETVLLAYFQSVSQSEFETVNPIETAWPKITTLQEFNTFFLVKSGNMVFDLLNTPLFSEED